MAVPNNLRRIPLIGRCIVLIAFACANLTVESVAQESQTESQSSLPEHHPVSAWPEDDRILPPLTSLDSIFDGFAEHKDRGLNNTGASAGQRAFWSTINIPVTNPREYNHIHSLDNDDPNSFGYTQRPNLFNIQVPDEWDFANLINTDRSDFTDTPVSVGKGGTILETGFTYTRILAVDSHTEIRTLPETLLRVGITDEFELRFKTLGYSLINQYDRTTGQSGSIFGMNDLDLGFKYEIFQQKNWVPLTTLVTGVILPSGTNGVSGNSVQPHFNLVNGWAIRRYLFLKHQFGLDYLTQPSFSVAGPGGSSSPYTLVGHRSAVDSYHSSISCLYQATQRIGGFVEWFTTYGPNQPTINYADTGLFIYLTPTVQLDCVIGSSIAASDDILFTKMGFSTRW